MSSQGARVLVRGLPPGADRSAVADLVIPALLLRSSGGGWSELVHIAVAAGPTVAFSSRDLRQPGILRATSIARAAGFRAVVRSPGGRMVAYDSGAVVIDHLTRTSDVRQADRSTFADHAASQVGVLRSLGRLDARVGAVEGEYCPGEFSVNLGGRVKVIGSAQRITGTGALFSTVIQVEVSDRVREVLVDVSAALGYPLRETSIGALDDQMPALTPAAVDTAFADDYSRRLALTDADLDPAVVTHALATAEVPLTESPFDVDAWSRAHPLAPG